MLFDVALLPLGGMGRGRVVCSTQLSGGNLVGVS